MSEGTPKRPSFGSKMFGGAKNLTPTKVPSFTMQRKGSKAAEPTGVGGAVWVRDDEVCYRLATVTDVSGGEMKVRERHGRDAVGQGLHRSTRRTSRRPTSCRWCTPTRQHPQHAAEAARGRLRVHQRGPEVDRHLGQPVPVDRHLRHRRDARAPRGVRLARAQPARLRDRLDAYRALCVDGSQAIITSGESGSGKTENTKQIFRFMAEIAGSRSEGAKDGGGVSLGMEGVLIT